MQISDSSIRILAGLLEARTGQQLTMSRRWRIETALAALLRERGIASLDELITILVMNKEPGLSSQVVEALLNNETYFFRDRTPFDTLLKHVLPALAVKRAEGTQLGRPVNVGAAIRDRILSERLCGDSFRLIADRLTADGIATAHGGRRWYASTVRAVHLSVASGRARSAAGTCEQTGMEL